MSLNGLLDVIKEYIDVSDFIKDGNRSVVVNGLTQVHKAHLCACVCKKTESNGLVIVEDEREAQSICLDLEQFYGQQSHLFLSRDMVFHNIEGKSFEWEFERINILQKLCYDNEKKVIVTTIDALMGFLPSKESFKRRCSEISVGNVIEPDDFCRKLVDIGYKRSDLVEGMGQFCKRGSVVDFFSPNEKEPIRIDFFDNEIDSMGSFDIITQRRTRVLKTARIIPAREVILSEDEKISLVSKIDKLIIDAQKQNNNALVKNLNEDKNRLLDDDLFVSLDRYLGFIYENPCTILDYFKKDAVVFLCEYKKQKETAQNISSQIADDITDLINLNTMHKNQKKICFEFYDIINRVSKEKLVLMQTFRASLNDFRIDKVFDISAKQINNFKNDEALKEDLLYYKKLGFAQIILVKNEDRAKRLVSLLNDENINAIFQKGNIKPKLGQITVYQGALSNGFIYDKSFICVYSEASPHETVRTKKATDKLKNDKNRIHSFTDLKPGDFIVHQNYGIGKFDGIKRMVVDGVTKDYIKISYAGSDVLYVVCNQLDMIAKYISPSGSKKVKLNKMGSGEFYKTKLRVKAELEGLAQNLIDLYAKRQSVSGFVFSEDGELQRDFEMKFEYQETDDQLRAIEEIKTDMQKAVPMDRLLCGDVGFGKTEVALRAIFKCILDSKQAALLAPTTILASQHYNTIKSRMQDYPIKIEVLSRFKTAKEQDEIIKKIANGQVDVVIGTHRLISQDVKFWDLGLLVVDEEQRFGVLHKERLKELSVGVDVLTLSATPIPRTLNMALSNVRDMSIIEEPPKDRMPVSTYVMEYDAQIVAEAVKKEIKRSGQVFYLHNKVEDIERTAAVIKELVPEARVVYAHGKMTEIKLSKIMGDFINGEADVLVCTTIIETGIDIPNVNTLIIEDADNLGLAQLHQIRGRVGRSSRRAYAYFLYRRGKVMTEDASKRLLAIKEFTQFGAGFKIALRDLEIRGAGNMLGLSQHGHIGNVGYEMYLRLLNEVVLEKKGLLSQKQIECVVDIGVDAYIPDEYIESSEQRIEIYKKIAAISNNEQAMDVKDELIDRYGNIPVPVLNLIDISLIRNLASDKKILEINQNNENIVFYLEDIDSDAILKVGAKYAGEFLFGAGKKPHFIVKNKKKRKPIEFILEILDEYSYKTLIYKNMKS